MKKSWMIVGGIVVVMLLLLTFRGPSAASFDNINNAENIEIYKSLTCGCCEVYTKYFDGKVSSEVKSYNVNNPEQIKRQHGVPSELESCHTTIIEGYFVEGHIPLEAIEKLLGERPEIAGIAMPGMPEGSPGMPGRKYGDFVIYAVNFDGTYEEFMRI